MITSAIVFDHRGRTQKGRPGPLEVRITSERKVHYVNTGVKVLRSEWRAGLVINRPDSVELNELLATMERAVVAEVEAALRTNRVVDVSDIKRAIWGRREGADPDFLSWFEETIPTLQLSKGTKARYRCVLTRLRACDIIKVWSDLTPEKIREFDRHLHNSIPNRTKSGRADLGAIYNYHKVLKAMIARAVVVGKVERNPYDRLRGQFKRGDKETVPYLTNEEVAAFVALEPTDAMTRKARDLFIFQLYTGLSYSDTQSFSLVDYKRIEGKYVHIGQRIKTGVPYVSQLLPPAVAVLERNGMELPRLSNQKYNICLHALGAAAGITTPLHSHVARHTFATMMLKHGVKIENVSRMLGHTNITQTQRYAKVLAQSVFDDFARIEKILTKNN